MSKAGPVILLAALPALAGCAVQRSAPAAPGEHARTVREAGAPRGEAVIRDAGGRAMGAARILENTAGELVIAVEARDLTPGLHGVHVHAIGACDPAADPAFSSAGGHLDPGGREHGSLNPRGPHGGDLPNLVVSEAGVGRLTALLDRLTVSDIFDSDGAAVVIHQREDDLRTDSGPLGPGNSGARLACGVLERR